MTRGWIGLVLLVGIVIGAVGALFLPGLLEVDLPAGIGRKLTRVEGTVVAKKREADRLLLTIVTNQGAILATFKEKLTEIDLLVEPADTLTLALRKYEPFVEDPKMERVAKGVRSSESDEPPSPDGKEELEGAVTH